MGGIVRYIDCFVSLRVCVWLQWSSDRGDEAIAVCSGLVQVSAQLPLQTHQQQKNLKAYSPTRRQRLRGEQKRGSEWDRSSTKDPVGWNEVKSKRQKLTEEVGKITAHTINMSEPFCGNKLHSQLPDSYTCIFRMYKWTCYSDAKCKTT